MITAAQRRRDRDARLAQIPWVSRVSGDVPCEGIKWGQVPLKHVITGTPDRARCKLRAKWKFTALRRKDRMLAGTTGRYCIHHLFSQIYDHPCEQERFEAWCKEQRAD